jgi:hypothetical protein
VVSGKGEDCVECVLRRRVNGVGRRDKRRGIRGSRKKPIRRMLDIVK